MKRFRLTVNFLLFGVLLSNIFIAAESGISHEDYHNEEGKWTSTHHIHHDTMKPDASRVKRQAEGKHGPWARWGFFLAESPFRAWIYSLLFRLPSLLLHDMICFVASFPTYVLAAFLPSFMRSAPDGAGSKQGSKEKEVLEETPATQDGFGKASGNTRPGKGPLRVT